MVNHTKLHFLCHTVPGAPRYVPCTNVFRGSGHQTSLPHTELYNMCVPHFTLSSCTLCPMYFLPPDTQLQKKYMLLFGGDLHLQCRQDHCRAKMLMLQMSKLKYRRGGVAYLWSRCLIMSKKRRCTIAICGNYCTTTPENKATMKVQKRVKIQKEFCPLHAVLLLSFQRH